jgi:hypothetical protein
MGGGAYVGALPLGASAWCSGQDVVDSLNVLFDQDPSNQQYIDAKNASLTPFQKAATSGDWLDLWNAYSAAFDAAGVQLCRGWYAYLGALGTLGPTASNGGNVATALATSSAILTFSSVPDWMADGLTVSDSTTPGAIISGQTVSDFDATTVTLTANVDATVNLGDTIVFSVAAGLGQQDIRAIAQARYKYLTANVRMTTSQHHPHTRKTSGHAVKLSGGIIVTTSPTNTSSKVLTFGAGNVPSWMDKGLNVYDNSTPGAIGSGQKVHDFDNSTVILTTHVDATVNSGDTIVFSPPPLVGSISIDSPWIPPNHARKRRGLGRRE